MSWPRCTEGAAWQDTRHRVFRHHRIYCGPHKELILIGPVIASLHTAIVSYCWHPTRTTRPIIARYFISVSTAFVAGIRLEGQFAQYKGPHRMDRHRTRHPASRREVVISKRLIDRHQSRHAGNSQKCVERYTHQRTAAWAQRMLYKRRVIGTQNIVQIYAKSVLLPLAFRSMPLIFVVAPSNLV